MKFLLSILPCLILMFQPLNAKVEAPNYNFSVDTLMEFFPGNKVSDLDLKYGKGEELSKSGSVITKKYYVAHIRYKFPVIVQEKDGEVLDFHARLPHYFLHDIFLQSLVNRFGKQNKYQRTGEEAYYVWTKDNLKQVYSGACTITCFPIFYSVHSLPPKIKPLIDQMKVPK